LCGGNDRPILAQNQLDLEVHGPFSELGCEMEPVRGNEIEVDFDAYSSEGKSRAGHNLERMEQHDMTIK
jgi:hypothetical protein